MVRKSTVLRLLRECRRLGLSSALTTNGHWGKSPGDARRTVGQLRGAGLGLLTLSYDRYHAAHQGPGPALNIATAAQNLGFPINLSVVRLADDQELAELIAPFERLSGIRLRFYDVEPVGRARGLPPEGLRTESGGFCFACSIPCITDDGRLTACNGPSYFAPATSPLNLGRLDRGSLRELLEQHSRDPVLETLRTFGPARLREELERIPEFQSFPFRERYHGLCDLCHHITNDAPALTALRERLADPQREAERLAARQVIQGNRGQGPLARTYVNRAGAAKAFLRAALGPEKPFDHQAEQILGRADLDWSRSAAYLMACGLARPLLPALESPELKRWSPRFFVDRLKQQAVKDGLKELVQREALRLIDTALEQLGSSGVLLKGTAVVALAGAEGRSGTTRATGDIDLWVGPEAARAVRGALLELGFVPSTAADRTSTHHLSPLLFQGVPIEIHERIMPWYWGLPEQELLAATRPLPGACGLRMPSPEGFFVHAAIHVSSHLFAIGLKTAWDLAWVMERTPDMDWDQVARWASVCRMPRAFWAPAALLCRDLGLQVPEKLLAERPLDRRQRLLEDIAARRLYEATEGPLDLNSFVKTAVLMLLQPSVPGALRYLAGLASPRGMLARRGARRRPPGAQVAPRRGTQLREALQQWRRYRRSVARRLA
jgi:hypothetical protein